MKKYLLSTFVLTMLLIPAHALSATTGNVVINGKVPIQCDITVTASGNNVDIADISAGATDLNVATVNELCNDPDGYTVSITGTNSGDHTGVFTDSVSGDTHPFTVKYNGVALSSTTATDVSAPAAGSGVDKDVLITFSADNTLTGSAGFTYSETLTFTITAK